DRVVRVVWRANAGCFTSRDISSRCSRSRTGWCELRAVRVDPGGQLVHLIDRPIRSALWHLRKDRAIEWREAFQREDDHRLLRVALDEDLNVIPVGVRNAWWSSRFTVRVRHAARHEMFVRHRVPKGPMRGAGHTPAVSTEKSLDILPTRQSAVCHDSPLLVFNVPLAMVSPLRGDVIAAAGIVPGMSH